MNPFEMVIGIVLIVTIGSIVRAKYGVHRDRRGNEYFVGNANQDAETKALQAEIRQLKERIQVLERIATDTLFFGALWLVARRLSFGWRLAIATLVECAWELVENSDAVIERYRTVTISLDYFGDSVLNTVCDVLAMVLGFWLASKLPVWVTVALIILFEGVTMWIIRDGLALNVLMLVWPLDSVAQWQAER